jgi:hypothetical protein
LGAVIAGTIQGALEINNWARSPGVGGPATQRSNAMNPDYTSQLYDQVDINSVFGGRQTTVISPYGERPSLSDWHEGIDLVHAGSGGTQWGDAVTYGKDIVVESVGRQSGYGDYLLEASNHPQWM